MIMSHENINREIRDLYERYASLIYRHCRFILRSDDDAWDVTQEVFMKLMSCFSKIENKSSIYSWLLSTSTNLSISFLRRKKGQEFDEAIHSDENNQESNDRRLIMKEIMSRLFRPWDLKTRMVVIYTYFDGYSQKEIAQLTGLGESTIRKYLTRFKRGARTVCADAKEVLNA